LPIKVLIVEDMATYRTIIDRSLREIEDVEVVGKVSNGKKALEFLQHTPDVDLITLDVEMPVMDGLATLKALRRDNKNYDVLMLSGLSDQAASLTIKCLELGAVDFVLKPQGSSFFENQKELVEHLRQITSNMRRKSLFTRARKPRRELPPAEPSRPSRPTRQARTPAPPASLVTPKEKTLSPPPRRKRLIQPRPKILLIGVSTGGPRALSEVFDHLKGPLPFPVLIVQHMPPKFTKSLAVSLDKKSDIEVVEGADGDVLEQGKVYIAPGGYHMILLHDPDFGFVLGTNQEPPVHSCRPAVDVLFKSCVKHFKSGEVVALIMTGMGRDGADGCDALAKVGAYVASQSEETCTIYGMPKAVEDAGLSDEVVDLEEIPNFITKMANRASLSNRINK
jgi:two-component system chemotaxis response regulator CheB